MKDYYSKTELRELGFTDSMIRDFLPVELAIERPNPYYCNAGAPMKFWPIAYVKKVMRRKTFKERLAKSKKRKEAAAKAVNTKVSKAEEKAHEFLEELWINWPSKKVVYRYAIDAQIERGNYDAPTADDETLNRWVRNMVRHEYSNYDQLWLRFRAQVGIGVAHDIIQEEVNRRIDKHYGLPPAKPWEYHPRY